MKTYIADAFPVLIIFGVPGFVFDPIPLPFALFVYRSEVNSPGIKGGRQDKALLVRLCRGVASPVSRGNPRCDEARRLRS